RRGIGGGDPDRRAPLRGRSREPGDERQQRKGGDSTQRGSHRFKRVPETKRGRPMPPPSPKSVLYETESVVRGRFEVADEREDRGNAARGHAEPLGQRHAVLLDRGGRDPPAAAVGARGRVVETAELENREARARARVDVAVEVAAVDRAAHDERV